MSASKEIKKIAKAARLTHTQSVPGVSPWVCLETQSGPEDAEIVAHGRTPAMADRRLLDFIRRLAKAEKEVGE